MDADYISREALRLARLHAKASNGSTPFTSPDLVGIQPRTQLDVVQSDANGNYIVLGLWRLRSTGETYAQPPPQGDAVWQCGRARIRAAAVNQALAASTADEAFTTQRWHRRRTTETAGGRFKAEFSGLDERHLARGKGPGGRSDDDCQPRSGLRRAEIEEGKVSWCGWGPLSLLWAVPIVRRQSNLAYVDQSDVSPPRQRSATKRSSAVFRLRNPCRAPFAPRQLSTSLWKVLPLSITDRFIRPLSPRVPGPRAILEFAGDVSPQVNHR